jgi:hypothetical protein
MQIRNAKAKRWGRKYEQEETERTEKTRRELHELGIGPEKLLRQLEVWCEAAMHLAAPKAFGVKSEVLMRKRK